MSKDDPLRIVQIEIEDGDALTLNPATPRPSGTATRPWVAAGIIALLFGALVVVLSTSSPAGGDDSAAPVTQPSESSGNPNTEDTDEGAAGVLGESRPAATNEVETTPLTHASVVLFDETLIALVAPATLASAPPLLQSTDGVDWTPIETSVILNGEQSTAPRRWRRLRVTGAGLTLTAIGSGFDQAGFISTNSREWVSATREVEPVDPLRSFDRTVSVTEESIIGTLRIERSPDDLNMADDVDLDLVRDCLRELGASFFVPQLVLAEFDRERRELGQVALHDATAIDTQALDDGRVVGVGRNLGVSRPGTCRDIVAAPPADSEFLFVLDPTDDSFSQWPLHPSLVGADGLRVIGEVSAGSVQHVRFVLATSDGLWTFDQRTEQWGSLGTGPVGPASLASMAISTTGESVFSLDGGVLQRWRVAQVSSELGVSVCWWSLPQEQANEGTLINRSLLFANGDYVAYQTSTTVAPLASWLIDTESLSTGDCDRHFEEPIDADGS